MIEQITNHKIHIDSDSQCTENKTHVWQYHRYFSANRNEIEFYCVKCGEILTVVSNISSGENSIYLHIVQ